MITHNQADQIFNDMLLEVKQYNVPDWIFNSLPIHVNNTALIAEKIAKASHLDSEKAYVMGMLHDLGKADETIHNRFHGIMGYERLKSLDPVIAHICLTHMFINNDSRQIIDNHRLFYGNEKDQEFIISYLDSHPADDYDLLIQLSDGLSGPKGPITIENRMIEYNQRHKLNRTWEEMQDRIRLRLDIKKYFEQKTKCDIYELLCLK